MGYISKLTLKNFKSYRNQTFEFHSGINIIKGEGLSGKTNIIRALNLLRNYSSRKNIKFRFALKQDIIEVNLVTSEGHEIRLSKGAQVKFKLIIDGKELEFRKVGQSTPEEVQQVLMLHGINFQSQLDLPFIVLNSASKLTKIVNEITGIDRIDEFLRILRDEAKYLKRNVSEKSILIEEILKRTEQYIKMDRVKTLLRKANDASKKRSLILKKLEVVTSIFEIAINAKSNIDNLMGSKKAEVEFKVANKFSSEIEEIEEKLFRLINYRDDIIESQEKIQRLNAELNSKINLHYKELKTIENCPYCDTVLNKQKIREIKKRLKNEFYIAK